MGELHVGTLIEALLGVPRHRHLQLPHELALLLNMLVMNQGMAATLAREFQLGPVLAPYAQRLVAIQLSPASLGRRLGRTGIDAAQLGAELPDQLRRLVTVLEAGGPEVHLRSSELEPLMRRAERIGERLAAAIIAAAVINGVAVLASRRRRAP